jgi:hypothetical protein
VKGDGSGAPEEATDPPLPQAGAMPALGGDLPDLLRPHPDRLPGARCDGQAALEAELLGLLRSHEVGGADGLVVRIEYLETVIAR